MKIGHLTSNKSLSKALFGFNGLQRDYGVKRKMKGNFEVKRQFILLFPIIFLSANKAPLIA